MSAVAPLLVGLAFGALLQLGGLTRHERIVGVFRLRDLAVLKFLLSAILAGAAVVQAARSVGLGADLPLMPTRLLANAAGGALFGVGMAVAGFCPGTIVAGVGAGRLDALVAVAGLWIGALVYGLLQPFLPRALAEGAPLTLPGVLGVSPWLLLVLLAELALLGFYVIERRAPRGRRQGSATSTQTGQWSDRSMSRSTAPGLSVTPRV